MPESGYSQDIHDHPRTAKALTLGPGVPQPGTYPFSDQAALQFGNGSQDASCTIWRVGLRIVSS